MARVIFKTLLVNLLVAPGVGQDLFLAVRPDVTPTAVCNTSECAAAALLAFKQNATCCADDWDCRNIAPGRNCLDATHMGSWVGANPCHGWAGVCCAPGGWAYDPNDPRAAPTCGGGGDTVTGLDLSGDDDGGNTAYYHLAADLGLLGAIGTLETLDLYLTSVKGKLGDLSKMASLTYLDLGGCWFFPGSIGDLNAGIKLTHLVLLNTAVGGDAVRDLTPRWGHYHSGSFGSTVYLDNSKVTNCTGFCAAHKDIDFCAC